jgi:hypothetical protein
MPKGKKLDVHYIIAYILNVHLSDFLYKPEKGKVIEIIKTKGVRDLVRREGVYDLFKKYIDWLNSFRDKLWHDSQKYYFDLESFKKEMEPLLYFYENILRSEEEVLRELIKPLEACFKAIDKHLKTSYFRDEIKELQKEHETVVKVLNCLGLPVSDAEVILCWKSKLEPFFIREYPLKIKTGPNGEAQISLMNGDYDVRLDKYGKKLSLTVPKDKKIAVKVPEEFQVGCPYCERLFRMELSDKWSEVTCSNLDCNKKWHEGVFRVLLAMVTSKDRRGLGRGRRAKWSIRLLTPQDEELIEFRSMSRLVLKQKDVLTISYRKTSKGIFKKKWTGEWDSRPRMLVNNTIKHGWIV